MPTIATVPCGDMVARYEQDQVTGDVRFRLLPASDGLVGSRPKRGTEASPGGGAGEAGEGGEAEAMEPGAVAEPGFAHESLVQLSVVGDIAGGARAQGQTLRNSSSTGQLQLAGHRVAESGGTVAATFDLVAEGRLAVSHHLRWQDGAKTVEVDVTITNISDDPFTLQLLTSFCLAGIGGPVLHDPPGRFLVHRIRTGWSSEARLVSEAFEDLHMERAWTDHAVNVERFGQVGSMPVRGFAPCAGIEDTVAGVTWAAQLAWAGSWQMELFGRGARSLFRAGWRIGTLATGARPWRRARASPRHGRG